MSEPNETPQLTETTDPQAEYYRTLVTDDEVVAALVKDSKRRDGTLPPERIKPNLNFLQRTVSNVLSTNTRIDEGQDSFKTTYTKENEIEIQVLQQIRSEKEASSSRNPEIDHDSEKDIFLKNTINFKKSIKPYSTVKQSNLDVADNEQSKITTEPKINKKPPKKVITRDYLRQELEKINKKIESRTNSQPIASCSSNKTNKNNTDKVCSSTDNQVKTGSNSNLSKEDMLKKELAALNIKIQEKLSKIKTEDTVLILDKDDSDSDLEIVEFVSSNENNSDNNKKSKTPKVKILQNIEISNKKKSQDEIRSRILSSIKQNQLELSNEASLNPASVFVCTKCGSCNSDTNNDASDRKPCTAIKCETIELSSSNSSDIELVSVKIEPKTKKKTLKARKKSIEKEKKADKTLRKERKFSRHLSCSSEDIQCRSPDREREDRYDKQREDRYDKQREDTYKARKQGFKSTIRERTKSRDSIRERTSSRERRASFRERDKERSSSRDRRARSFSRFSSDASYERYIKDRDKSQSRSRSGSRDSRKRDSSTDSEQERYQAHMLAQQRFEERARREYWMNRIIREYQNRYRIPRIPQRHRLVDRRKQEPPAVQSKVVVVPKRERDSSSGSDHSRGRERRSRSSSFGTWTRDSSSEKSFNLDNYNLDTPGIVESECPVEKEITENLEPPNNNLTSLECSAENIEKSDAGKDNSKTQEDPEKVILKENSELSSNVDDKSPKKRVREGSNDHSLEEGEISNKTDKEKGLKKKKFKKKKAKKDREKDKDKYVWKQVEVSSNVVLHVGTELE